METGWGQKKVACNWGQGKHSRQEEQQDTKAGGLVQARPPSLSRLSPKAEGTAASCHSPGSGFSNLSKVGGC